MKTLTMWALALVAWAGLVGCTTPQPPNASAGTGVVLSPQDEAAVRATVAEFVNTWNHHAMKGLRELVTEDVLSINFIGNIWRGKAEVCGFHDILHRTRTPVRPLSTETMEVHSLAPQVAVATARMKFGQGSTLFGQEEPEFHTRDSFVMAKRGGAWKIVHFHSTVMHPNMAKNDRPDFGVTR